MSNTLRDALLRGNRRPPRRASGSPLQVRGDGYEFAELRAYVPGDDVRRIDWAATARSGELQTRVMLEEHALTLGVLVDQSASMQCGRQRSLLDAAGEIADLWRTAALRSDRSLELESLADARARLPRGGALLVVADMFWFAELDRYGQFEFGERFDCTALVAEDPWQADLPLSGFARVADAESGSSSVVYIGKRERERFYAAARAHLDATLASLHAANWRAHSFREDRGVESLYEAFGIPPA